MKKIIIKGMLAVLVVALSIGVKPKNIYADELEGCENTDGQQIFTVYEEFEENYYLSANADTKVDAVYQEVFARLEQLAVDLDSTSIYVGDLNIAWEEYSVLKEEIRAYFEKNGETFFFIGNSMGASSYGNVLAYVRISYAEDYCDENGYPIKELIEQERAILQAGVAEIMSGIDESMTDLEKALYVHDWIVMHCDYDYANYLNDTIPDASYSAMGVFKYGLAVCQGYAEAYALMMNKLGIDNDIISSSSMNHAWNMIELDGSWYHVDATWDDPVYSGKYVDKANGDYDREGYVSHTYFIKSDDEMEELDHYGWQVCAEEAAVSSAYTDYAFRNAESNMVYYDGSWIYIMDNAIYKSSVDGRDARKIDVCTALIGTKWVPEYVLCIGDTLIWSQYAYNYNIGDWEYAVYALNMKNNKVSAIMTANTQGSTYPEYEIIEMGNKLGNLRITLYNDAVPEWKTIELPESLFSVSLDSAEVSITYKDRYGVNAQAVVPEGVSGLQYRWSYYSTSTQATQVIQDWSDSSAIAGWNPGVFGEYKLIVDVRSAYSGDEVNVQSDAFEFNPHIKGKCQMPYYGEGGGYLIGVESYENPNQSYYYEMLILDCTLLAKGEDAWVYTTGKYRVDEGNAGWCIWQPQYGYYWTLFRVYDANGNMIDQACYGFANAY